MAMRVTCAVLFLVVCMLQDVSGGALDHLTTFTEHRERMEKKHREKLHGPDTPKTSQDAQEHYSEGCAKEEKKAKTRGSSDVDRVELAKCKIVSKRVAEGEEELRKEADAGSSYAHKMLGGFLHARNDSLAAIESWKKCAEMKDLECDVNIGMTYLTGANDVKEDHAIAFKHMQEAAKRGNSMAQYNLGMMLLEGLPEAGVAEDRKGALSNLLKAAQQKNTKAMIQLALQMLTAGQKGTKEQKKQQAKGAVRWLNEADKLGNTEATTELGITYKYGRGVRADLDKCFKFFKKSAEAGDMIAQYELALLYIYDEDGGAEAGFDDVLAKKWMKAAAEQGHPNAMHNYAHILLHHEEKHHKPKDQHAKDVETALSMYAAAATSGVVDSLFTLGVFHSNGQHQLSKNHTIACQYFGACSRLGYKKCHESLHGFAEKHKAPEALFQLGRLYEEGSADGSVSPDKDEASRYLEEARLLGSPSAKQWEETRAEREAAAAQRQAKKDRHATLVKEVNGGAKGEKKGKRDKATPAQTPSKADEKAAKEPEDDEAASCNADEGGSCAE
eukprot:TRINITY_DN29969_c0_g1_i1.p1 TRINITY_DN29969_c0_g1~~TRINITY_DN29969_c0_g1_i1.p1  ORF type:complete len:558 (+),score=293.36 TRINITY_DN29969_c0_g1_i1:45-1718(+)